MEMGADQTGLLMLSLRRGAQRSVNTLEQSATACVCPTETQHLHEPKYLANDPYVAKGGVCESGVIR